ncbi:acetyltransferase [Paenisporosarcina cavernae]|uniref:Acetyltransferase n=1 Tax=Paenisporosarcina cavernae TaxID=2320858 RepID=A0A385YQU1_9BACL|nr:acetyltransferase [Paenisporosarcina cavernae]AYC28956.1 acetyltransferase [Paenisporosarcina cavernae]
MNKPLIILGNGGHASVLSEILKSQSRKIIGFTSPQREKNLQGIVYLGEEDIIFEYSPSEVELVLGLGSTHIDDKRKNIFTKFIEKNYRFSNVIHSSSIISPSCELGQGVQLMAGSIIQANTKIADNTIINTGAKVDHDCIIESHVHIAPGTTISGNVIIGESTHIGVGSTIIQGITIGKSCMIGAGSVLIRSIHDESKVYGVPAKEVK